MQREIAMADYELYGDYNSDSEEERGPAPHPFWKFISRLLSILTVCILLSVCLMLGFRIILSHWYPTAVKRLYYTEELAAYAASGGDMTAKTQDIRVPFESEFIETDGETLQVQTQQNGYYYADNLIVIPEAGAMQFSVRLNKSAIAQLGEAYGVADFAMSKDAFEFVLIDNNNRQYTPSAVLLESKLLYHYLKICFDGIDYTDVAWMRLEITPSGADKTAEEYEQLGICVYENHDTYSTFEEYRLKKSERYVQ